MTFPPWLRISFKKRKEIKLTGWRLRTKRPLWTSLWWYTKDPKSTCFCKFLKYVSFVFPYTSIHIYIYIYMLSIQNKTVWYTKGKSRLIGSFSYALSLCFMWIQVPVKALAYVSGAQNPEGKMAWQLAAQDLSSRLGYLDVYAGT